MQRTIEFDKHLGAKIKQRRLTSGLSSKQLADKLGITHQQLNKYERGTNRVAANKIIKFMKIFNEPSSFFFNDEEMVSLPKTHQRMAMEVSRNFLGIENPEHQVAINDLIRKLKC